MTWQKGQSGNPGGLPGRPRAVDTFAAVLRDELEQLRDGQTTRARIAHKAVQMALKGDLDAMKWIADRTDGKIPERLETEIAVPELLSESLTLELLAYAARRRALAAGPE